jgi:hypothetical protein
MSDRKTVNDCLQVLEDVEAAMIQSLDQLQADIQRFAALFQSLALAPSPFANAKKLEVTP